jgi:hypothetical protein
MGPRAGLDDMEKRKLLYLPGFELRHLGRPARGQSLYRLRYSGFQNKESRLIIIIIITLTIIIVIITTMLMVMTIGLMTECDLFLHFRQ